MEYQPITLPNSKEVILVQPVSPFLLNKLKMACPPPKPPIQRVPIGDPDNPVWEESANESHPDYIEARQAWSQDLELKIRRLTIATGAKIEWTEEKKARLRHVRDSVQKTNEETGMALEIEADDDFAYISYIACQSGEDYQFLLKHIMSASRPTEEAIQEGIATFRPDADGHGADIPGAGHIQHNGSTERDTALV